MQERDWDEGIRAYGVDGYPGDCVLLALRGIMIDNPPDLVISGINGGPNLGFDWLASGTIGAARLATVWGVPAIAVSGLNADSPVAATAVAERAGILLDFRFGGIEASASGDSTGTWALKRLLPIPPAGGANDAALYQAGYVVVPMLAEEHDHELLSRLIEHPEELPGFATSGR